MSSLDATEIMTFGDARRQMLNDIASVRNKELTTAQGDTMAALYHEVNSSLQIEINAAKLALVTQDTAHKFGRVVAMGKRLISNNANDD